MKKEKQRKIIVFQIIAIIFSISLGTFLHFTYELSNDNSFVALFSAVNESTWEHLKLVFFPMLIFTVIEFFFVKNYANNYFEAKTIGIFTAIAFITVFFYTYTGILGTNFAFLDISSFVIAIILGEFVSYKLMIADDQSSVLSCLIAIIILMFFLISFTLFTYFPPKVNYFKDPITKSYGID